MDFISLFQERADRLSKARADLVWWEDLTPTPRPAGKFPYPSVRGVYEVEFPPFGMRAFNIVTSIPGEVGYVQFPSHWVTKARVANLWRLLDHLDPPRPQLEVIKRDPSSP